MKIIIVFLAALVLAQAKQDWSKIEPLNLNPKSFGPIRMPEFMHSRIVGGVEAEPHSRPFQAALFIDIGGRVAFCGGSLIHEEWVLTAAHCVQPAKSINVTLGAHNINEEEDTAITYTATEFFHHENWSMLTLTNDIALVRLPTPVKLNENIQLVKLPEQGETQEDGTIVIASGWGKDKDSATAVSPVLREVEVPILAQKTCNLYFFGIIRNSHVCTDSKGGKSTCSGDSGGPLTTEDGVQVGLVSFGISFGCEIGWPAAYTRVSSYVTWINSKI